MAYVQRHEYTERELLYATLRDLATDIRCAIRDGLPEYAEQQKVEFRQQWLARHTGNCSQDTEGNHVRA